MSFPSSTSHSFTVESNEALQKYQMTAKFLKWKQTSNEVSNKRDNSKQAPNITIKLSRGEQFTESLKE